MLPDEKILANGLLSPNSDLIVSLPKNDPAILVTEDANGPRAVCIFPANALAIPLNAPNIPPLFPLLPPLLLLLDEEPVTLAPLDCKIASALALLSSPTSPLTSYLLFHTFAASPASVSALTASKSPLCFASSVMKSS